MASCRTVLVVIQESKTDNEKQTDFQIKKNWNSYNSFKKNTEHFFITVLQYTVYLKYRNSKPVKLQRPKCIPKVESTISQCVSCAPHTAHMPSLLQVFPSISRVVSYTVQTALFLLESSLSFPLLWFFLPTQLFQPSHLLLKVLMLIPRWGRKKFTLFLGMQRYERFFELYANKKKTKIKTFFNHEVHTEACCNAFHVIAGSITE